MIGFIFGAVAGAAGYWAYQNNMLPGSARSQIDSAMGRVRSLAEDYGLSLPGPSGIVTPTPSEVATRPAEPIPGAPTSKTTAS